MSDFKPGLEGVVAFETEIAEPDRDGGALRYRGVDIEELVGHVPFEKVWGLLVDGNPERGLEPVEPFEVEGLTGDTPADLQWVSARLSGVWGFEKLIDISDDQAEADLRAGLGDDALRRRPVRACRRRPPDEGARRPDRPGGDRGRALPARMAR